MIIFALVIAALAGSLFYTPDYLHLNVNLNKRMRWQIKIRWRLIAAGLVIGLLSVSSLRGAVIVVISCACFTAVNFLANSSIVPDRSTIYFWTADMLLLGTLLWTTQLNFLIATALIAAAIHLSVVTMEKKNIPWAFFNNLISWQLIFDLSPRNHIGWNGVRASAVLFLTVTLVTAVLVARAHRQNAKNVRDAGRELQDFTGYTKTRILELWATSNEELAKNWKDAHLDENDREKMTAWYRENSELYMFAISGYNLEYKRIRDSIRMLRYGRGACLDYGAGNGEIILELARRGHAAIYFDVDGTSMRFARHRAERQKLAVDFFHSKDDLAASAQKRGLDTIFSFDVLEHLPDLPGELKFLASLLNPGGRMAFDVPAGSTESHPMHLNHHLDIHAHMASIGMVEERGLLQSIPFRKQEKYVFRKPV